MDDGLRPPDIKEMGCWRIQQDKRKKKALQLVLQKFTFTQRPLTIRENVF